MGRGSLENDLARESARIRRERPEVHAQIEEDKRKRKEELSKQQTAVASRSLSEAEGALATIPVSVPVGQLGMVIGPLYKAQEKVMIAGEALVQSQGSKEDIELARKAQALMPHGQMQLPRDLSIFAEAFIASNSQLIEALEPVAKASGSAKAQKSFNAAREEASQQGKGPIPIAKVLASFALSQQLMINAMRDLDS